MERSETPVQCGTFMETHSQAFLNLLPLFRENRVKFLESLSLFIPLMVENIPKGFRAEQQQCDTAQQEERQQVHRYGGSNESE